MESLFLQILNMSITATWIVLAVCLLRFILKKAPKWVNVALWGLVAFRLVCPFSFESVLSLLPSAQTVPTDIAMSRNPSVHTGVPALNSVINPVIQGSFTPIPASSVNPLQVVNFISAVVWIIGMVGMLLYATVSFLRLHKKTKESVVLQGNVYLCDRIDTPFILGLFRPRIYLPSSMEESDVNHVLTHENAHLARRDHWWKPLGFLLLTVHWFNPVLWLAYILLCRDIELACDEKVIRNMDVQNKKDYSSALINCSVSRKSIAACPLAFGEVGVKNRIKTVLHYKKPTLWILIAAVILSCIAAVCLLTNPVSKEIGGYEYRVSRYYHDDVIGEDRANRELGEYTYEIDENLSTVRYINGNFHCHYTLVPVSDETEKLIAAVESTLPAYYKLSEARQVYFREGWDSALREQSELNYFIIQYSDGSLIGGYIGAYDEVPGQIYKLQRIGELTASAAKRTDAEKWFDSVANETPEWGSVLRYEHPSIPDVVFEWKEGQVYAVVNGIETLIISGMPVLNVYFCDLTGDGLPDVCATVAFGSGMVDEHIVVYDYAKQKTYTLHERGENNYWLMSENGDLFACKQAFMQENEDYSVGKIKFDSDSGEILFVLSVPQKSTNEPEEFSTVGETSQDDPDNEVVSPNKLRSLMNEAEWVFSKMASIGDEKIRMLELTVDDTQDEFPLVRIKSEDELNRFVQYVGNAMALVVENLNINAGGNKRYDVEFFEENDLVFLYLEAEEPGEEYALTAITQNEDSLCIAVVSLGKQSGNEVKTGALLTLVLPKSITKNMTDIQCNVWQFRGFVEGSVKDFESLISGISTLEDVQSFAPGGEYLFLESGRGEPRVSTHFTADNYVVSVEYDENNKVKKVTKRVY